MQYDPEKHHWRSIRLKGYDYAQEAVYFVTVCTQNRACLFGAVADGEMQLNNAGKIAKTAWDDMPARIPSVRLDAFIVMPNHVHGIIMVGAQFIAPQKTPPTIVGAQFIAPSDGFGVTNQGAINHAPTLGEIVRAYKAASTRLIRQAGTADFAWQRNYYEYIVRNEESLGRIRQYILDNPARWAFDRENPAATAPQPEDTWCL
jgi:putative transposase